MANENATIGHFIDFALWKEALKLLNFQIASKQKNRHFSTLSMYYYESLGKSVEELEKEDYFNDRVANDLFYGLEREYSIFQYVVPKAGLGLRNYKFLTYPLRALYYSIGLYLLRLSQEFLSDYYYKKGRIRSYYGGFLRFEGRDLKIDRRRIYFLDYYKQYKRDMRSQLHGNDVDDRVIIHVDIQNYYDSISIPILLEKAASYCKDSIQAQMCFDASTREEIVNLFRYLMSGNDGIPQADNDLVSSFVGFLYLAFADLLIEDQLQAESDLVDYRIIRYMDDIAISLTFHTGVARSTREQIIESLASRLADLLYYDLGLKLNAKTRMFWLGAQDDRSEFKKSLKKVSPQYYLANDDNDEKPNNKVQNILDELSKLKKSHVAVNFQHDLQDEILKEVFDPIVRQLLAKPQNLQRIHDIFIDFNFNLVRVSPLPIMVVLLYDEDAKKSFVSHLLSKNRLTTNDVQLMLVYLCQTGFEDDSILEKLGQFNPMQGIYEKIQEANLAIDSPGYYELDSRQIYALKDKAYVIDQIRLRILSEKTSSFSVALNHLLNEIHIICFQLDTNYRGNVKSYDANNVIEFLQSRQLPNRICITIRKLFDRRNANQVSHPGSEQSNSWGVSKEEYYTYKQMVGEALQGLLQMQTKTVQ